MKYTVLWVLAAEHELARLWMDAGQRYSVSGAANEIEKRLAANPGNEGESRSRGQRILLIPPLGVTYEIAEDDRIVRVLDVWRF